MREITAPNNFSKTEGKLVFLAGSIEMGKADNWQQVVTQSLKDETVTLLNPRRLNWDDSWMQSRDDKHFRRQVEWELSALEAADIIVFYFDPNTLSPISLLELGLFSKKECIVCCPEGYFRKRNIDIVCERYSIWQVDTLDQLVSALKRAI